MSMDAHVLRFAMFFATVSTTFAASHRTANFIVTAPNRALAKEIAEAAEGFRHNLSMEWLGRELPQWQRPCPILAHVRPNLGAGGKTSFSFRNRQPFDWEMEVQGSRERILDSVLPHEVTHTIFATHFGRPLPRWADEGACTTVEHASERKKQDDWLIRFIHQNRGIPFNHMFRMTEYPEDIMPLYAQGYSVARYLIFQGGKRKFVEFVGDGMQTNNWNSSLERHYGYNRIGDLQLAWEDWLSRGRPIHEFSEAQDEQPGRNEIALVSTNSSSTVQAAERRKGSRPVIQQKTPSGESWYEKQANNNSTGPTTSPPEKPNRLRASTRRNSPDHGWRPLLDASSGTRMLR